MPNKDSTYEERTKNAGKDELACELWYTAMDCGIEKYGFDLLDSGIKPYDFAKMPNFIKNTPDYAMIYKGHTFLIEAKGCRDVFKIKLEDLESYSKWNDITKLVYFIYSTKLHSHVQISHTALIKLISSLNLDTSRYPDNNKEYYPIHVDILFQECLV